MGRGSHWLAEMQRSALSGCPVDALWESLHSGGESALQGLPLLHAGPAWLRDGAGTYLNRPFHTLLAKAGWRIQPGVPTSTRLVHLHLVQHSLKTFVDAFAICFFALFLFSTSTLVPVLKPLHSLPPRSVFFPSLIFPSSWDSLVTSALCHLPKALHQTHPRSLFETGKKRS